jgi:sulfotransferase
MAGAISIIMNKTVHFVSGLPRAGANLLSNILAQNPRFDVTPTSGIIDIVLMVRNRWNRVIEFQAAPDEPAKLRVMRSVLDGYFDNGKEKPVVFDRSPAWLSVLEMAEAILDRKAKVLVSVRDVRDVLASYERLWRRNAGTWEMAQETQNYYKWQTVEGRCEVLVSPNQPVGICYNRIQDALSRGFKDRMHFVDFDDLTRKPRETLAGIYEFLEETPYQHDLENIQQVTQEDDMILGIPGLHEVRPVIEPSEPQWPRYLGSVADKYAAMNTMWRAAKNTTIESASAPDGKRPSARQTPALAGAA